LNYQIKDPYHQLIVKLNSNIKYDPPNNNIYLKCYVNDSSTAHSPSYIPLTGILPLTFRIRHSDFQVGDVITKIQLEFTGSSIPLHALNEGVSVLIDGKTTQVELVQNNSSQPSKDTDDNIIMVDTVTTNRFGVNFADSNEHTVQAIYKGNSALGVGLSNKLTLKPEQQAPTVSNLGDYKLEIIKMPSTMKYMSAVDWQFKLTRGGEPVGGKTVEKVTPANIWSDTDYDKDGIYKVKTVIASLPSWNVGKYKCGARFYHQQEPNSDKTIVCSVFQNLEITKNTPRITKTVTQTGTKGKVRFKLLYPAIDGISDSDLNIPNKKLTIKVGGKTYNRTTNEYGNVNMTTDTSKAKTFKVTFAGDKNLNKLTKSFTVGGS